MLKTDMIWVESRGQCGDDMVLYQPLKSLHHYGCKCHRAVVVEAGDGGFSGHWYDGGGFKIGWNNSLFQQGVKDVHKHLCQLVGTLPEYSSWNVVRTCCITYIHIPQGLF